MASKLNPKQQAFCEEYMIDLNATQAAIRAGYSEDTARTVGPRMLSNVAVQEEIVKLIAERSERTEITADRVLRELGRMGFANMMDYVRIEDGEALVDLSNLTRDEAAAITEVTVEEYTEGRGPNARDVKRTKIKLGDKNAPLNSIAKHIGLYPNTKLELTGKDGGPIDVTVRMFRDLTDDELDERISRA